MSTNSSTDSGITVKGVFDCIRLAVFAGVFLAIPVALGFELEYTPTAIAIGVGTLSLFGLLAILRTADPKNENLGIRFLKAILVTIALLIVGATIVMFLIGGLAVTLNK